MIVAAHVHEEHPVWEPPPRCTGCGHRVGRHRNTVPVRTLKLGPWWWLAEVPMRWLARAVGRDGTLWAGKRIAADEVAVPWDGPEVPR